MNKMQSNLNYATFNNGSTPSDNYKKVLKNIQKGNILEDGQYVETPLDCKLDLKLHQKRMVYEMMAKENMKYRVSSGINKFVICDKVGSGKSICVLSLISLKPTINYFVKNLCEEKNEYFYLTGLKLNKNNVFKTNLIVVPHSVYNQWIEYLSYFPNLTYYGIRTKTNIDKLNIDELKEGKYNVLLVKSTKYNKLLYKLYDKYFIDKTTTYNYDNEKSENEVYQEYLSNSKKLFSKIRKIKQKINSKDCQNNYDLNLQSILDYTNELQKIDFNEVKKVWKEDFIETFNLVNSPIFERVFIDEANSINIPNCQYAYGKYNWFITSSLNDLFFPKGRRTFGYYYGHGLVPKNVKGIYNNGFIKTVFSDNHDLNNYKNLDKIYLKNNDEFIKNSFQLEVPIKNYVECFTPLEIELLEQVDLPHIIDALNANDMETAISLVDGNIKSDKDITHLVLHKLETKFIKAKERKLKKEDEMINVTNEIIIQKQIYDDIKKEYNDYKNEKGIDIDANDVVCISGDLQHLNEDDYDEIKEIYLDLKNKYEHEKKVMETLNSKKYNVKKAIEKTEEKLKEVKNKYEALKERISNISEKNCPVCLEKVEKPTMTPCCKNVYCFSCLMYTLESVNQCAICRAKITVSQCTIIDNNYEKEKEEKKEKNNVLPKKIDKLMDIITTDNTNKRFLVFSSYEKSFDLIQKRLIDNDVSYSLLKGSTGHISNIINDYKNDKYKVLLLNAKFFGSGLNLQMTSDIIIYHRMDAELEKQIIGRGQRLGRTGTLKVHYLCHRNELP